MKFTRLPYSKRVRIIQCFIEDIDATTTSKLLFVNRKTINAWYREIRRRLLPYSSQVQNVSKSSYKAFETRRLQKFYGLRIKDLPYHIAESRLRHVYGRRFRALIIDVTEDLLTPLA